MSEQQRDYGCHFTWGWLGDHLKNKTLRYIKDRIESLDREVEFQEDKTVQRDLPRLYALKGFLTYHRGKTEGNDEWLDEGKDFLERALEECGTGNLGYKYIIVSNLKCISTSREEKLEYANNLMDICSGDGNDDCIMREVHAMQAYAAGHFHLRKLCMEHYEMAGTSQAEWCFGLALVNEKNGLHYQTVLELLDHAIELDKSYVEAKLKKAKILFLLEKREKADRILKEILKDHKNSLKIMEEVAMAYSRNNPQKAINLFEECYNTNNQRQKALRGLGSVYLTLWNNSTRDKYLDLSIKYRSELVSKEDNSKIFDLTNLAESLLCKYSFKKDEKMKKDLKRIYSRITRELNKKQLNTDSEIETCFRIAKYHKKMNNETEEIKYLGNILGKVGEAKKENNSNTSQNISMAITRLQELIEKKHEKSFQIKIWLLKYEEKFDEAIEFLEEKEEEEGLKELYKEILLKEKANCYVDWVQNEKTEPGRIRSLLQNVEVAVSNIKTGDESKLDYIYRFIPEYDDTKRMKVNFEKLITKLKDIDSIEDSLYSELLREVKLVLDRTIHYLYMVVVPDGDPQQNTSYPNMSEFITCKTDDARLVSLEKKLKSIFWRGTKKAEGVKIDLLGILPQLKDFNRYFVSSNYPWYEDLHKIRNLSSHKPDVIVSGSLKALGEEKLMEMAINATFYAACVFRFVKTIQTE